MRNDLSAQEAADILGISLATLYSYVSRGLLTPGQAQQARRKTYDRDAVMQLAARRADAKRGGHQAAAAMHCGVPVLETRISRIADGSLHYRGIDALELAASRSLESVACQIWDGGGCDYFDHPAPVPATLPDLASPLPPLEMAMAMLPLWAGAQPVDASGRFVHAAALMRLLAAILLGTQPSSLPFHVQIGRAWQASETEFALIRTALVLLADHELNASTFAVRCVSSTGASLAAALGAGLAALSGPLHGGGSAAALALIQNAMGYESVHAVVTAFFAGRDPALAGFGHPLYPAGDLRAAFLLGRIAALTPARSSAAEALEIGKIAHHQTGAAPNMDFALAALATAFDWPPSASLILFAVARSAGWLGHAVEQADTGALFRPRARYIGTFC